MKDLTPKQIKSIAKLCEGRHQNSVAAAMDLNPETLRRWSLEPSYKAA
jgi:DNA-binding CsgD family transcriptional regulator